MLQNKTRDKGIFTITNEEYHSSPGISRSGIVEFKNCPKKYWHKYINPDYIEPTKTKALVFGNAFHTVILEPDEFNNRYIIKPEERIVIGKPLRLKDVGREAFEADKKRIEEVQLLKQKQEEKFELESLGKTVLTHDEFNMISRMQHSIISHDDTRSLIWGGLVEKSIYWIDEETQLICKVRPDIMHDNFIVDIKTTENASYKSFQRSMIDYNYHIQMAMIQEGIQHILKKVITDFLFICVEKDEPHCHGIYPIDDEVIEMGKIEFHHYLRQMKECFDNNNWPGYPTQLMTLPSYTKHQEL